MHDGISGRWRRGCTLLLAGAVLAVAAAGPGAVAASPAAADVAREADVKAASAAYAAAFNDRALDALAAQWTENAELVEGGVRLVGRKAIVASLGAWLDRHPQARLAIEVTGVEFPAAALARVAGRMTFTAKPGAKPVVSRFVSLRVLEDGVWQLAESVAMPTQAAQLDELDWLVGTWKNDPGRCGDAIEAIFSRPLGDSCIVGRVTCKRWGGSDVVRESLHVIHADRATGLVRTWVFDSTGARADGVVESDGPSFHATMVGTPAETAVGRVARWVQVIAPAGEGRFTMHEIERSIDGVPLPDGQPVHLRKIH